MNRGTGRRFGIQPQQTWEEADVVPVRQSFHRQHSVGPIHMPGVGLSLQAQPGLAGSPAQGGSKQV